MEPYEAREIAAQAWCDNSTSHLDMIPELAEAFAKILVEEVGKASPASAPEVSENQKDGERYRWLRSSSTGPSQIWELLSDECNPPILTLKSMGDLDAAIDAAMQEDKP